MKAFLFSFLALVALPALFAPEPAHAIQSSAKAVRILLSSGSARNSVGDLVCTNCGNVGTSTWIDFVASTSRALKGIDVYSTADVPFEVAIGSSGAEATQIIVPPGSTNNGSLTADSIKAAGPHFYPVSISQGTKVSFRALNSSATFGEVEYIQYYY